MKLWHFISIILLIIVLGIVGIVIALNSGEPNNRLSDNKPISNTTVLDVETTNKEEWSDDTSNKEDVAPWDGNVGEGSEVDTQSNNNNAIFIDNVNLLNDNSIFPADKYSHIVTEIEKFLSENEYEGISNITIMEETLYGNGNTIFGMIFYLNDEYDRYINLTYNKEKNPPYTIVADIYDQMPALDENDLARIQEEEKKYDSCIDRSLYNDKTLSAIKSLVQKYYKVIKDNDYWNQFSTYVGATQHFKEQILDFHYDYYSYKLEGLRLKEMLDNGNELLKETGILSVTVQDYLEMDNYYLVKINLQLLARNIKDTDGEIFSKWITIFRENENKLSIFPENIELLDIWKTKYRY